MSGRVTANLPARDFGETAAFYGRLGFAVAFRSERWMILRRDGLEIEFFLHPGHDPATSWFSACVRLPDPDALLAEWRGLGIGAEGIPRLTDMRQDGDAPRMFALVDPNGSLLRVMDSPPLGCPATAALGAGTVEVYGDRRSGNCLKVMWALDWLGRPYRWIDIDILAGESRTPEFLAMNPAGQVPVMRLPGGRSLAQSNAIVLHLLEGSGLVPEDPLERAGMHGWMFWEQYSHEPLVVVRRFQRLYLGKPEADIDPALLKRGTAALDLMDRHLAERSFLVGESPTVADLCLLPYTRAAPEGGFDLGPFPSLRAWIQRTVDVFRVPADINGGAA